MNYTQIEFKINGYIFTPRVEIFPGGDIKVNILDGSKAILYFTSIEEIEILCTIKNSTDIMVLMLVKNALDDLLLTQNRTGQINFTLVLPYARQDRICVRGESFSLKVFADLINSMNFNKVTVYDAHSIVSDALINNCRNISQREILNSDARASNTLTASNAIVVSPDAGAEKKAFDVAQYFNCDMIRATKRRNMKTGKIEHIGIIDEISSDADKTFIIVDDICSWMEEGEEAFINYLMDNPAETGILSFVADTWDFFEFLELTLPKLKEKIMNRDGKFVIRPDSGDPVKMICGYKIFDGGDGDIGEFDLQVLYEQGYQAIKSHGNINILTTIYDGELIITGRTICEIEAKGLVEYLWDVFGGTVTDKGFKLLDEHIGAIYGDAITLERQEEIISLLKAKKFVPSVVLGVGSYSYQYVTRDTHGSAVKATNMIKNGESIAIFKDPKTDSKKKSAKGLLRVELDENGRYVMLDEQTRNQADGGCLAPVFHNGTLLRETSLETIRERMDSRYSS